MTKTRVKKSDQLPQYGTSRRTVLAGVLTSLPAYVESLEKGHHLFTKEELDDIEKRYDTGLTWEDIERELSKKHISLTLKKVTFRKYIKDGLLPRAKSYRITVNGRVAVFPPDTIRHINIIRYFFKVATGDISDQLFDVIRFEKVSLLVAVESQMPTYGNLWAGVNHYLVSEDDEGRAAIELGLAKRKDFQKKALDMLYEIDDSYKKYVVKKVMKLEKFLKENYIEVEDLPEEKEFSGDVKGLPQDKKDVSTDT